MLYYSIVMVSICSLSTGSPSLNISLQVSVAMLYYSIVMVSIGSLSAVSSSVNIFSSGECGNAILEYCYGFNMLS